MQAYGVIQKFVECLSLGMIACIRPFRGTDWSILKTSGNPCRPVLQQYSELSVISRFILEAHPLDTSDPVLAISVQNLISKSFLVQPSSAQHYVIKLPNNFEHHEPFVLGIKYKLQ